MRIHTNGGSLTYNTIGSFKYLPIECYFNQKSIANVLSLKSVADAQGYDVIMNTNDGPEIYAKHGDTSLKFQQSRTGLYYCITNELKSFSEEIGNKPTSISLLSTINKQYSNADIKRAEYARNLQKAMMWPSSSIMKNLITYNL